MGACGSAQNSKNKKKKKYKNNYNQNKKNTESTKPSNLYKEKVFEPYNPEKNGDYILPTSLAIHDDITKYYLISQEILGQGASGTVAIGENSDGKFAIKRVNKMSIKSVDGIYKEAEFAKLNHPNIIKYYGVYEDLKTISFVMELAEGGDLFDFITSSPLGHLPLDICIDLMVQICETLVYLHCTKKIVHRDLKPENILITISGNNPIIKLIDFGMSTFFKEGEELNEFLGTPQYSAPELVNHYPYNEKVDIWATGVILFNMLTGYEPFKGESRSTLDDEIKYKDINFDLIEYEPMKEFCEKLLQRVVDDRIDAKTALQIAKDIKEEREEYYKEEEDKEKRKNNNNSNNNNYMGIHDIEKTKNDVEVFWGAYTNRIGI